ncbi:MAG TPA: hypothetical protein VMV69_06340 [Pirellulales bacterium]|nr:hypothetical protein [Pirellulales bacterium]
MSEDHEEHTDLPLPGSRIQPRGFALALRFHSEIKLDRKRGHGFAAMLSEYLNIDRNELESHSWSFVEPLPGDPESRLVIGVTPNTLRLEIHLPSRAQEWVEHRFQTVLDTFSVQFQPQLVLNCQATVRGTIPIDGDARTFLAGHIMQMPPERVVQSFRRPVHLIGLRFFFPPYHSTPGDSDEPAAENRIDWSASVRAESLLEDPTQLFLEAETDWFEPTPWNDGLSRTVIDRLATTRRFLEENVRDFLQPGAADVPDEP